MCNRHESFSAHHTETLVEAKYLRRRLDVSSLANWFIIALVTASEMLFPCQHQNDQRQSLTILAIPRSGLQCTRWSRAASHSPATNILRAKTPTFIEMIWTLQHFAHRVPVWVHALDVYQKKVAYQLTLPPNQGLCRSHPWWRAAFQSCVLSAQRTWKCTPLTHGLNVTK